MTSPEKRDENERKQWAFVVILLAIILMLIAAATLQGNTLIKDKGEISPPLTIGDFLYLCIFVCA